MGVKTGIGGTGPYSIKGKAWAGLTGIKGWGGTIPRPHPAYISIYSDGGTDEIGRSIACIGYVI